MDNIIIPNIADLEAKKRLFMLDGKSKIHILSSFDKTLTKATFSGKKIISFISKLRNGNYISKSYAEKAQELYNKYHAIEISQNIDQEAKNKAMIEWWTKHYNLLIECGLNREVIDKIIEDMIRDKDIVLREGAKELINYSREKGVPIIILSATGLGNVMIDFLKKQDINMNNINFIGNTLEFDSQGKFTGIKDNKIIHTFNKNEAGLKELKIYNELRGRRNVILLCDSLADLNMINGFAYKNILKIGFFNYPDEENIEDFKKAFDIVITDDGSINIVKDLLKEFTG